MAEDKRRRRTTQQAGFVGEIQELLHKLARAWNDDSDVKRRYTDEASTSMETLGNLHPVVDVETAGCYGSFSWQALVDG